MTVGSLFAGIGGFDLAAERVFGSGCVKWQVEIDPWAQRVLAKHWPSVPRFSDIRTVTGDDLEPVDLICGGFPCQDISFAGAGAGIDGSRSGLWAEYVRLLRAIHPRFVVVENVAALLDRGMGRVLGDLASLGYDAEWDCIPAAAVGAPHIRDRVWLLAYSQCDGWQQLQITRRAGKLGQRFHSAYCQGQPQATLPQRSCSGVSGRQDPCESRGNEADNHSSLFGRGNLARSWEPEPSVGRVDHGLPAGMDRLRGLGNAVVPQVAEFLFRRIQEVA